MILLLCACINVKEVNNQNWLETFQSGISLSFLALLLSAPFGIIYLIIKNFKFVKEQEKYESFNSKYGKLWEDLRTDSKLALIWTPLLMSLKAFYVVDILLFEDGPIIQLYLAVSS